MDINSCPCCLLPPEFPTVLFLVLIAESLGPVRNNSPSTSQHAISQNGEAVHQLFFRECGGLEGCLLPSSSSCPGGFRLTISSPPLLSKLRWHPVLDNNDTISGDFLTFLTVFPQRTSKGNLGISDKEYSILRGRQSCWQKTTFPLFSLRRIWRKVVRGCRRCCVLPSSPSPTYPRGAITQPVCSGKRGGGGRSGVTAAKSRPQSHPKPSRATNPPLLPYNIIAKAATDTTFGKVAGGDRKESFD